MNFFEQELRKIVGSAYPDATYIGRACYVRLGEENRAKIQFVTGIVSNQYNALQMTILNRSEGTVDTLRVSLTDLLGKQATKNPNFRNGVEPHIWDDNGNVSWYVYQPSSRDYQTLTNEISEYLGLFQQQTQSKANAFDDSNLRKGDSLRLPVQGRNRGIKHHCL